MWPLYGKGVVAARIVNLATRRSGVPCRGVFTLGTELQVPIG